MFHASKLSAVLAGASVVVLSAPATHATVHVPRPMINIPKPMISVAVPKPAVHVTVPRINAPVVKIPAISPKPNVVVVKPATNLPKVGTVPMANNGPIKPGTVPILNQPKAPAKPAAMPAPVTKATPAPTPAPKKITWTPVEYAAFTDQYGTVKGYYVNGKLVWGLNGPTGGSCSPTIGYQTLGGGGAVSSTPKAGMVSVKAVLCYVKS